MIGITFTPAKQVGEIKMIDFRDYKFRCHYLGNLIGSFLNKIKSDEDYLEKVKLNKFEIDLTDKQTETAEKVQEKIKNGKELTKTDKTFLNDVFLKKQQDLEIVKTRVSNFGYELEDSSKSVLHKIWNFECLSIKEVLKSKAVRRGKSQEDESIDLVNQVFDITMSKNTKRFENDFFTGEPDLITEKSIIDIKTCESWETFYSKTEKKANEDYFYQVWAYMILTGKKEGLVAYTLPSYDDAYITYDKSSNINIEEENQIFLNLNFDRIPKNKRVKIFKIENKEVDLFKVYQYLNKCRQYLDNLTTQLLNFKPFINYDN